MLQTLVLVALLAPPAHADAKATFTTVCSTCHGPAGKGDGPAAAALNPKPANFTDPAFWAARTDDQVKKAIKGGGPAVGKSPSMPPNPAMTDAQLAEMVAYLKTLKGK